MSNKSCGLLAILIASLALSAPAQAATGNITVKASVLKPVELTGGGTINLGTIVMPSTATFSGNFVLSAAASQTGTFCASGFSCTGTPTAAIFNVRGTKNTPVLINIPTQITMTLQGWTGGGTTPTIVLTTSNSIASNNGTGSYALALSNSGAPGTDFYIGGAFAVTQATAGGDYEGTFTVTADYQ